MTFLGKIFQIKEGEGDRVFRFFLCFFFLIASLVVGRTARDTFFLSRFNPAYLPQMFILSAVAIAVTIAVYTRISKRFSLVPFVITTFAIGVISYLLIQIFMTGVLYALLYVWFEVIGTVMVIQFWLLANGAFSTREAKRLFGIIGSGGALANTLVGFSIRPFVGTYGTDYLLPLTSGFIGLALLMIFILRPYLSPDASVPSRSTPSRRPKSKETKGRGPLKSPYLKVMTITIVIAALVGSLVDYQMKIIVSRTLDEAGMAALFGMLYGIIGTVSVVMQFFVTGRILSTFGVLWGLMFLPIALVAGNMMILFVPVLVSAVMAKGGDQIFRFTIHGTASQLLWLPVPAREKGRAKPFIDGTMRNSAQGLSGLLILGMMSIFHDVRILSIPSLILLALWILSNFKLKQGYVAELRKAIEKRRLDFESLEIDITDPFIVETLRKTLYEGDDNQKLFALDTMKNLPLTPWTSDLQRLFHEGSAIVRKRIMELARDETDIISNKDIVKLMSSGDDAVAAEAMIICGERKVRAGVAFLKEILGSENNRRRSAAAAGLLLMGDGVASEARQTLDNMLYHPNNDVQIAALQSVGHFPDIVTHDGLATLLRDDSPEVRRLATELAAKRTNPKLILPIVENLESPTTAPSARRALKSYDEQEVASVLIHGLGGDQVPEQWAVGIIRSLGDYARKPDVDVLIHRLDHANRKVSQEIVESLLKISRRSNLTEDQLSKIGVKLETTLSHIYRQLSLLHQFEDDDSAFLIRDLLETTIQKQKAQILKLSLLPFPDSPVETFLRTLTAGDPGARANVLEILDNLLSRDVREKIVLLFDDAALDEKVRKGEQIFHSAAPTKEGMLLDWVRSPDNWTSAVALDYILTNDLAALLKDDVIRWGEMPDSSLHKEICTKAWNRDDSLLRQAENFPRDPFIMEEIPMYSTLEKTIFMKGVDLFRDIPGEEVSHLAQIAEEVQLGAEELIFEEGNAGDSMFIIVDGSVRIHKGDKEIATLSKGKFIGEMALLDQEPRSASATTTEESVLLRIDGEDFYDLMASRMEIMQGIVKVLTQRLREAIA